MCEYYLSSKILGLAKANVLKRVSLCCIFNSNIII